MIPMYKHPEACSHIAECKAQVTKDPGSHPDQEHLLYAYPVEEERDCQDKEPFGDLSHNHLSCSIFHTCLVKEEICKSKIERKRNANKYCSDEKDQV